MRPTIQYSRNGDDYTMTYITGDGRELAHTFQLGVELEETTMDGRKVLVLLLKSLMPHNQLIFNHAGIGGYYSHRALINAMERT